MSTTSIASRLQAHIRNDKLDPNASVRYLEMPGATKDEIRSMEQTWINQSGGVDSPGVGNKMNSVRNGDWDSFNIRPPIEPDGPVEIPFEIIP